MNRIWLLAKGKERRTDSAEIDTYLEADSVGIEEEQTAIIGSELYLVKLESVWFKRNINRRDG